jgi:hypothetical protein
MNLKPKAIIKELRRALKNCCDLFDEIEANKGVAGLQRALVEYRYNGRAALRLREKKAAKAMKGL